jgi:uncharacterized membrane protein
MGMERTMKTLAAATLALGLTLGAVSSAFAADDKKCAAGSEWNEATQKCVEKKS